MNTQRYFIELAYDGTPYHGWQTQPNALTVQQCLDTALTTFYRLPTATLGCGRTDSGVHAKQFFAHADLPQTAGARDVAAINSLLPYSISVKRIFQVAPDAHARFDATSRTYEYHFHFHKDPFKLDRSWLYKGELDFKKMNAAAPILFEYTDFSCFSKSNTQTFTNNCKIMKAELEKTKDGLVFTIQADRFLRNMVRAIVGTLVLIGKGDRLPESLRDIIESKDRSHAGQSVPACGLYLTSIEYPYV